MDFLNTLEAHLIELDKCFVYRDVSLFSNRLNKNIKFPALILTRNGIFAFVKVKEYGPRHRISHKCGEAAALLMAHFNINYASLRLYAIEDDKFLAIDFNSNSAEYIEPEDIENKITRYVTSEDNFFNEEKYKELEKKADEINVPSKGAETMVDEEGNEYVKKGGKWVMYSDIEPDEAFHTLITTGLFGGLYFKEHRFMSGIFYFLTCGGYGFFWVMDILQMLFGVKAAGKNVVYKNLTNKKSCLIKLAIAIPVGAAVVIGFTYLQMKLLSLVAGPFAQGLSDILKDMYSNIT